MRRPIKDKRNIQPDRVYNSIVLERFINYVMHDGEKSVARKVVYDALEIIKEKIKDADPIEVFNGAMKNAGPLMEVKSRRIGGANYQVPIEVPANRRMALAMRWLIGRIIPNLANFFVAYEKIPFVVFTIRPKGFFVISLFCTQF